MHNTAVKKVVRENVLDANDTLAAADPELKKLSSSAVCP